MSSTNGSAADDSGEPKLATVPDPKTSAPRPPAPPRSTGAGGEEAQGSRLFLAALLALVILVVLVVVQTRRVGEFQDEIAGLESQVAALGKALSAAEARVERYEVERGQIRRSVGTLRKNLLELEALVGPAPAQEPVAAPSGPTDPATTAGTAAPSP